MVASLKNVQSPSPASSRRPATKPWPFSSQQLAERLVSEGFLPAATVASVIADATASGRSVATVLLARQLMSDFELRDAIARIFGLPAIELSDVEPDDEIADFPSELARTHMVFPVGREGDRFVVAVADPTRQSVMREVFLAVGRTLDLRVASYGELARAVSDVFAPRLVVKAANGVKTRFMLPPGDIKIGRASHNEIVVHDAGVSATHAILRSKADSYEIVDFGSRNGVFVNGERIRKARLLRHKDEIRIGDTSIKFKMPALSGVVREEAATKSEKQSARMHRAWITFSGRIIAHMLGAAALIFLGLAIGGGLPATCSMPNANANANGSAANAVSLAD